MFSKRMRKWSLTRQFLALYLVAIVLIILIFFTVTFVSSHKTMMNIGTQNAQAITNSSLIQLSSMIDDIEYQFFLMQNNHELQHLLSESCTDSVDVQVDKINNILGNYDIFQRRIQKFELYSLTKDYYPSVRQNQETVFRSNELNNDMWYKSVISSGSKTFFDTDNDINGTTYITMSKVLSDTNSMQPIAIVKAYINADTFYSLIKDIRIMQSGRMFITSNTHIINPDDDKLISSFVNNRDIYGKIIPNKISSSLIHTANEQYRIFCYPVRETGLYLIAFVNTAEFNTLGHSMIASIVLASLLLMLFVFLILYFISSSFIKPIQLLSHDMSKFEDDPNKVSIPRSDTSLEIRSLYRSYESMRSTITDLLESTKSQAQLQRETEFRLLQAQIKPHFLYNTLGSISALADKINAVEIKQLASSLATYFRTSLNNGKELIALRQELEQAISYAEIQKIRYPDKFELKISVSEEIMDFSVCKLILQPLIENCIIHAFKGMEHKGIIEISGRLDGEDIILTVSDNGYGLNYISTDILNSYTDARDDSNSFAESHFGIYNISQRIHLYYGNNYGLTYSENDMGGITATIRLSKQTQYGF